MNRPRSSVLRDPSFWVFAVIASLSIASPAAAADLQSFVDGIKDFVTGPFGKSVAVIAIAITGYRFFTGRASAGPLVAVIGGCFLIFGAEYFLTKITGG